MVCVPCRPCILVYEIVLTRSLIVLLLVCRMLECCCSEDEESGWKFFQVLVRSAEMCLGLFLS